MTWIASYAAAAAALLLAGVGLFLRTLPAGAFRRASRPRRRARRQAQARGHGPALPRTAR